VKYYKAKRGSGLYARLFGEGEKTIISIFTFYFLLLFGVGCGRGPIIGTHPTPQKDTLLEATAPVKPNWITEIPRGYFLGEGQGIKEKEAYESAIGDMLKRYAEHLGADFKVLTLIHQEEIKRITDEVHRTERRVITEIEALSKIITAGSEIRKRYWEKWGKMSGKDIEYTYYKYWVLGEVKDRFIEEERERIKRIRLSDFEKLRQDIPPNSDLTVEIRADKKTYAPGDTAKINLRASDDCYAYILNFYGEGKAKLLKETMLEGNCEYQISGPIMYGGKPEEIIYAIVSDKPLDINQALKEVYPLAIIENLRQQRDNLNARFAGKSITIFIVPK